MNTSVKISANPEKSNIWDIIIKEAEEYDRDIVEEVYNQLITKKWKWKHYRITVDHKTVYVLPKSQISKRLWRLKKLNAINIVKVPYWRRKAYIKRKSPVFIPENLKLNLNGGVQ